MKKEYAMYAAMAVAFLALVVGIWWTQASKTSDAPAEAVATSTEPVSSATSSDSQSTPATVVVQKPKPSPAVKPAFSLVSGDTIASWNFKGTHNDDGQLEARVRAEIERMKGLLNSGTFTNYELYVSIANQYELLGEGQNEYTYLGYALAIDSTKTGLAWYNMGVLMRKLGACGSARVAMNRAVSAQAVPTYLSGLVSVLEECFPEDTAAIDAAKKAVADFVPGQFDE